MSYADVANWIAPRIGYRNWKSIPHVAFLWAGPLPHPYAFPYMLNPIALVCAVLWCTYALDNVNLRTVGMLHWFVDCYLWVFEWTPRGVHDKLALEMYASRNYTWEQSIYLTGCQFHHRNLRISVPPGAKIQCGIFECHTESK